MKVKKIFQNSLISLSMLLSSTSFAGAIELPPAPSPWYVVLGGGYAWSNSTHTNLDLSFWDPALEGYNSRLGYSPFITLGVGKRVCPILLSEVTSSYFNDFLYRRYQSSTQAPTPGFTGTSRVRHFDLNNFNVLYNLILNSDHFGLNFFHIYFTPFIGVGGGLALNTVKNFYTNVATGDVTSIGLNTMRVLSGAGQAEVGLMAYVSDKLSVDMGYRYYYGGDFRSVSSIFITTGSGSPAAIAAPAWRGTLTANILFAEMRFSA